MKTATTNANLTLPLLLGLGLLAMPAKAQYSDGFEGALNTGFWSTDLQSGYVVCPSATRAHSGTFSLELVTTNSALNKNLHVYHQFPAATYGSVSVWIYDSGADVSSGNYISLLTSLGGQQAAAIGTYDYDLGPGQEGSTYHYWIGSVDYPTAIDRTQGWHLFSISFLPDSLKVSIDNQVVYTGAGGQQIDKVSLYTGGPDWRPAGSAQFDDFLFTPETSFSDDFEGKSLDPFWLTLPQSGYVVFPGTNRAHSGSQSVEIVTTDTGQNKNVRVYHLFTTPSYGTVSVWLYDTGADASSANYITFYINSPGGSGIAGVGTVDYDLGPGDPSSTYVYAVPIGSGPSLYTGIDRTQAWHQFTISSWSETLTLMIDGTVIYTGPGGKPIGEVHMVLSGPSWRPAWSAQFDDFQFVSQPAQPSVEVHLYAGLTITGTVNAPYEVQYKTSLNSTNWLPLADFLLPSSPCLFFDTNSPSASQRFYRVLAKP